MNCRPFACQEKRIIHNLPEKRVMKIILEDGPFSYQVDWAKEPLVGEEAIQYYGM